MKHFPKAVENPLLMVVFGLIILFEGLGLPYSRQISFFSIISAPFFFFLIDVLKKRKVVVPKSLGIITVIFLAVSFISTFSSVNVQQSFEHLLFYTSLFLWTTYAYNHKEELEKNLPFLVITLSIIFCVYFLFLNLGFGLTPTTGYQFVYSSFVSHNHLGDFLVMAFVVLFFGFLKSKNKILPLLLALFFTPFYILSYSRSAYIDLFIVGIFLFMYALRLKIRPSIKLITIAIFGVLSLLSIFLFIVVPNEIKHNIIQETREELTSSFGLEEKYFFANRQHYVGQSLYSLIEKPLFGFGPGNYYYASTKYKQSQQGTDSSHNIFLDVFVENGILAGLIFILLILRVFDRIKLNLPTILAFTLLLSFQTDYTFRIYSFSVFFAVLIGLIYQDNKEIVSKKTFLFLSSLLLIFTVIIGASNLISSNNKYILAFYVYPLNKSVYEPMINKYIEEKDEKNKNFSRKLYSAIFKGDSKALRFIADTYAQDEQEKEALHFYIKAYEASPYEYRDLTALYDSILKIEGEKEAVGFAKVVLRKFSNSKIHRKETQIEIMKLCQKVYNFQCPYTFRN